MHPKKAKEKLGMIIVERFHSKEDAGKAQKDFNAVDLTLDTEIPEMELEEGIWICKALMDVGLSKSTSQARRDIDMNAVSIDRNKISDNKMTLGKGKFVKVNI